MFIGIVENLSINRNADTDAGLAISNMTLAAWSHGVGSCIIGACDRTKLFGLFHLTERSEASYGRCLWVSGAYRAGSKMRRIMKSVIIWIRTGTHVVPKRRTEDVVCFL